MRPTKLLILRGPSGGRGREQGVAPRDFYEAAAREFIGSFGISADFATIKAGRWLDAILSWGYPALFAIVDQLLDFGLLMKGATRLHRYDVVLGWYRAGFYLAALKSMLRLSRPRLVLVIYRSYDPAGSGPLSELKRGVIRRVFRAVDRVLCVVPSQVDIVARQLHLPVHRVRAITMGIDSSFFVPAERGDLHDGRPVVLIPGDSDRDEQSLIEALRDRPVRVVRVCRARWSAHPPKTLSENFEYRENVTFVELARLYGEADIVVLPVRNRTHPAGLTSLLECMAAGRPALIAKGLTADYVIDGVNAVVYDPDVTGDVELKLGRLLSDESLRRSVGEEARRAVDRRFALGPCSARLAEELLGVVEERAR